MVTEVSTTWPARDSPKIKRDWGKGTPRITHHCIVAASGTRATRTTEPARVGLTISDLRFASSVLQIPSISSEVNVTGVGMPRACS